MADEGNLRGRLCDRSETVRKSAVQELMLKRSVPDAAEGPLSEIATSADDIGIRVDATYLLGRLLLQEDAGQWEPNRSTRVTNLLARLALDQAIRVREAALWALALPAREGTTNAALEALLRATEAPQRELRTPAVVGLRKLQHHCWTFATLLRTLVDEDLGIRRAALDSLRSGYPKFTVAAEELFEALGSVSSEDNGTLDRLYQIFERLSDDDVSTIRHAAWDAARVGLATRGIVMALKEVLVHSVKPAVPMALWALSKIHVVPHPVRKHLRLLTGSTEPDTREASVLAIASIEVMLPECWDILQSGGLLYNDVDPRWRAGAVSAVGAHLRAFPLGVLRRAFEDPTATVRSAALASMEAFVRFPNAMTAIFNRLAADPDEHVAKRASRSLSFFRDGLRSIFLYGKRGLQDSSSSVRSEARSLIAAVLSVHAPYFWFHPEDPAVHESGLRLVVETAADLLASVSSEYSFRVRRLPLARRLAQFTSECEHGDADIRDPSRLRNLATRLARSVSDYGRWDADIPGSRVARATELLLSESGPDVLADVEVRHWAGETEEWEDEDDEESSDEADNDRDMREECEEEEYDEEKD